MACAGSALGQIVTNPTLPDLPPFVPVVTSNSIVLRSNNYPIYSWSQLTNSAAIIWNSNMTLYVIWTNSLNSTAGTNVLLDQPGTLNTNFWKEDTHLHVLTNTFGPLVFGDERTYFGKSLVNYIDGLDGSFDLSGGLFIGDGAGNLSINGSSITLWADGHAVFGGAITVGGGAAMQQILSATATLDFPSTGAGGSSDLTVTVTGAAVGDCVWLGVPNGSVPAGGTFFGWVSASDTVSVRFANNSGGALDPSSGTFRVSVARF
jgi:hypothetical protein